MLISRAAASGRKLVAGQLPAAPTTTSLPLTSPPSASRWKTNGLQPVSSYRRAIFSSLPLVLPPLPLRPGCKLDAITRIRNICTVQVKLDKAAS